MPNSIPKFTILVAVAVVAAFVFSGAVVVGVVVAVVVAFIVVVAVMYRQTLKVFEMKTKVCSNISII